MKYKETTRGRHSGRAYSTHRPKGPEGQGGVGVGVVGDRGKELCRKGSLEKCSDLYSWHTDSLGHHIRESQEPINP